MKIVTFTSGIKIPSSGETTTSHVRYVRGQEDSFVKEQNPNWKAQVAKGEDATTNYSRESYKEFPVVGTHWWYSSRFKYFEQVWTSDANHSHAYPAPSAELILKATNIAEKRWASKLADLRPQVMSGVIAGELKETINMIAHPYRGMCDLLTKYLVGAKRIRQGVLNKRLKRKLGKFNGSRHKEEVSALHAINGSYLETIYGVLPLLNDINGIIGEVNRTRLRHTEDVVTTGFADGNFNISGNNWDPIRPNYVYCNFERSYYERASVKKFARLIVDHADVASSKYGGNLQSFVPSLWELLPMSFMLDYVTNIGDVISALSYQTPSAIYSYTNVKSTQRGKSYFTGMTFHESLSASERAEFGASFPDYVFERTSFSRSKGTAMAPSGFVLEVPSARQALNASSVLLSIFQSR